MFHHVVSRFVCFEDLPSFHVMFFDRFRSFKISLEGFSGSGARLFEKCQILNLHNVEMRFTKIIFLEMFRGYLEFS